MICYAKRMKQLKSIIGNYPKFLTEVLSEIKKEGFSLGDFAQLDHLCYRTTSSDNYLQKKAELSEVASLLGETMVNNRPIATFRFHEPIKHGDWRIDALELPAPKPDNQFEEGLEHIEFVLFDSLHSFQKKHSDKLFETKSVDRGINPELGFKLKKYAVKFHLLSLPTVIYLEKKLGIAEVKDSQ